MQDISLRDIFLGNLFSLEIYDSIEGLSIDFFDAFIERDS
jgi:hypothetical protein